MTYIFGRKNGEVREKYPRDLDLTEADFAPPEQRHAERAVAELKALPPSINPNALADDMAERIPRIKALVLKLTWGEMDEMCKQIAAIGTDMSNLPAIMHKWAS
jgi:hypothetical protein